MNQNITPSATISEMGARTSYEDPCILNDYLAHQLRNGSLAIILGAGASLGFGLPGWEDLVDLMHQEASTPRQPNIKLEVASENLWASVYNKDRMRFAQAVRDALYKKASLTFDDLRKHDLLAAIGALAMASSRGNVAKIVSFNFDDIIKLYLSYFGYDVCVTMKFPDWNRRADVHVLHPHGLLPSDPKKSIPHPIIFTQADYDDVIGNSSNDWHEAIVNVFRSHTCLFIGLSGNDSNLTSLLKKAHDTHACCKTGELFWGIRFAVDEDPLTSFWETRGVFHRAVAEYGDVPKILFDICQRAARLHQHTI